VSPVEAYRETTRGHECLNLIGDREVAKPTLSFRLLVWFFGLVLNLFGACTLNGIQLMLGQVRSSFLQKELSNEMLLTGNDGVKQAPSRRQGSRQTFGLNSIHFNLFPWGNISRPVVGLAGPMFHFWCPVPVQVRTNTQTYREAYRGFPPPFVFILGIWYPVPVQVRTNIQTYRETYRGGIQHIVNKIQSAPKPIQARGMADSDSFNTW